MLLSKRDFTDCKVLIFDTDGSLLLETKVQAYNKSSMHIEVAKLPESWGQESLRVLIFSSPVPCEFQGRIFRLGSTKEIALFQGKDMELRSEGRYSVDMPAQIEGVFEGENFSYYISPLKVILKNISISGVGIYSEAANFVKGQALQLKMSVGESHQIIKIKIVHGTKIPGEKGTYYGCNIQFVKPD